MDDLLLDVCLDFDTVQLATVPDATRLIYEASQAAAVAQAERAGGHLRHSDPRATNMKTAINPLTGQDVLLVSTRWVVDGARGVEPVRLQTQG